MLLTAKRPTISLRRGDLGSAAADSLPLVVAAGWRILSKPIAAADWQALGGRR
jgi:hypothetical protein